MTDKEKIAEQAEVILGGYAVMKSDDGNYCVVNLERDGHACVFSDSYEILETSMDEIESEIAKDQLKKAKKYMEEENA